MVNFSYRSMQVSATVQEHISPKPNLINPSHINNTPITHFFYFFFIEAWNKIKRKFISLSFQFCSSVNFFYNRNDKETCSPPWIINCRLYVNDYYNIIKVSFKTFGASTANTAGRLLKILLNPQKIFLRLAVSNGAPLNTLFCKVL